MTSPSAVEVLDATFTYPGSPGPALAGVSVTVDRGEVVAVVGESGSGKSTLARLVAGLLRPGLGSVRLGGVDLPGLRARDVAARVGIVFQHPNHQLLTSTVRDELALGPRNVGLAPDGVARRVQAAARTFGLEAVLDHHPMRLPLPVRRRVGLAAVIAMDPPVLVLDEPTAGLDASETSALVEVLHDVTRRDHRVGADPTAVLVVTHDLRFAGSVADRVVVLRSGAVVAEGDAVALLADGARLDAAGLEASPLVRLAMAMGIDPGLAVAGVSEALARALAERGVTA